MTEHVWNPSPSTREAGERARVRYLAARPTAPGEQRAPSAALVAFRGAVVRAWAGVESGGIERDAARRVGASEDPHRDGIAVDLMLREGPSRVAVGDALAAWCVEHAELLGLQYVLWSRFEWSASTHGAKWERYTGSNPHVDHVHVELGPDARAWTAAEMRERVVLALADTKRSLVGPLVLAVLCAAGAWWCSRSEGT